MVYLLECLWMRKAMRDGEERDRAEPSEVVEGIYF